MASTWSTLKYIKHYRAELIQDDSTHEPVMSVTDKTKVKTSIKCKLLRLEASGPLSECQLKFSSEPDPPWRIKHTWSGA